VGAHVGFVYAANDDGARRVLHQAWHHDTRDEALADFLADSSTPHPRLWVDPSLDVDEQNDLRAMVALVASKISTNQLPYALQRRDATVAVDGGVVLGTSLGLTCATFVTAVFAAAGVSLLDDSSWEARDDARVAEDDDAQRRIAEGLMSRDRNHAQRVRAEVGCTRVRAEEVAAASGMAPRPVRFVEACVHGAALRARLAGRA
jgi:hypothetical protein